MCQINNIIHEANIYVSNNYRNTNADFLKHLTALTFENMPINKDTSLLFIELIELVTKLKSCKNFDVIEFVVRLGSYLLQRAEIDGSFWYKLMDIKLGRNLIASDGFLEFLLSCGISESNLHSWNYIAFLLKLCYSLRTCKVKLNQLIRYKYCKSIGILFNSISDFQLCNYLMEMINMLLSKELNKKTDTIDIKLWVNLKKNDLFFNDINYPFGGRHGDESTLKFIYNKFGSLFINLFKVIKTTYIVGVGKPRILSNSSFCFIQIVSCYIYFWDGNGLFLQINIKGVNMVKDLRDNLKITLIAPFNKVITSPHNSWISSLSNIKSFVFELENKNLTDMILNTTKISKISEVKCCIALNLHPMYEDEIVDSSISLPQAQVPYFSKDDLARNNEVDQYLQFPDIKGSDQLVSHSVTPDKSEDSIDDTYDNWKAHSNSEFLKSQDISVSEIKEHRQLPLALIHKSKQCKAISQSLDELKESIDSELNKSRDYNESNIENPGFISDNNIELKKCEVRPSILINSEMTDMKRITGIKKQDISLLNDIFGGNNIKVKTKKQQRLKNFEESSITSCQDSLQGQNINDEKCYIKKPNSKIGGGENSKLKRTKVANKVNKHIEKNTSLNQSNNIIKKKTNSALNNTIFSTKQDITPKEEINIFKTISNSKHKILTKDELEKGFKRLKRTQLENTSSCPKIEQISHLPITPDNSGLDQRMDMSKTTLAESTTNDMMGQSFTEKLQEQIFSSITNFSTDLIRKITIINEEMNKKIVRELSGKYQNLFMELQESFRHDISEMSKFVIEIKDLLHLPENELVQVIRNKKLNRPGTH